MRASVYVIYGPRKCGKNTEAIRLAEQLRAENGWEYGFLGLSQYEPVYDTVIIQDEGPLLGMCVFDTLVGNDDTRLRPRQRWGFNSWCHMRGGMEVAVRSSVTCRLLTSTV